MILGGITHVVVVLALALVWWWLLLNDELEAKWAKRRTWLDLVIVGLGVGATAVASLVLEDIVPGPTANSGHATTSSRLAILALTLWPLLFAVAVRQRLQRDFGTLFYGELLLKAMSGRHVEHLTEEARLYAEYQEHRAQGVTPSRVGIDFVPAMQDLAAQLNAGINSDSITSGFHFAPNLLWPAAAGLGSQLARHQILDLVELDDDPVRWRVSRRVKREGFDHVGVRNAPGRPEGLTCVLIDLSNEGPVSRPKEWEIANIIHVASFDASGAPRRVVVRTRTRHNPETSSTGREALAQVHPSVALEKIVEAIGNALSIDVAPIIIAARMPKILAVALGIELGKLDPHPWSRIALLNFNPGPEAWSPTRCHPDQPDLPDIARRLDQWAATPDAGIAT